MYARVPGLLQVSPTPDRVAEAQILLISGKGLERGDWA